MQDPELHSILSQANTALKSQDHDEAVRLYTLILDRAPKDYAAHTGMGIALMKMGRHSDAVDHFSNALGAQPDSVDAMVNLACAYHTTGEQVLAENLVRRALERDPANIKAKQAHDAFVVNRTVSMPLPPPSVARMPTIGVPGLPAPRPRERSHGKSVRITLTIAFLAIAATAFFAIRRSRGVAGEELVSYAPETCEFRIDVPKDWEPKRAGLGRPVFGEKGGIQIFAPKRFFKADVAYVIAVMRVPPFFHIDDLPKFAGHLDSRPGDAIMLGLLQSSGPRCPIMSRRPIFMDGAEGMEFELQSGDNYSEEDTFIWHRMVLHNGRLYSLLFTAPHSQYKKHIDRIRKSAVSFKFDKAPPVDNTPWPGGPPPQATPPG